MRAMTLRSELGHPVSGRTVAKMTLREAPAGRQYAVHLLTQLSCPWEFQPFLTTRGPGCIPHSPKSRLQAETLPVSHRAISLVSCRAVAILIMSLRRGIPPSLISRGQYLSAVDRDRQQVIRVGFLSACCPETHPCCKNCPPRRQDEDSALSEGTAATGQEPCLPSPGAQVPEATWGKQGMNPLEKALPFFASRWHFPPPNVTQTSTFYSEKFL